MELTVKEVIKNMIDELGRKCKIMKQEEKA